MCFLQQILTTVSVVRVNITVHVKIRSTPTTARVDLDTLVHTVRLVSASDIISHSWYHH